MGEIPSREEESLGGEGQFVRKEVVSVVFEIPDSEKKKITDFVERVAKQYGFTDVEAMVDRVAELERIRTEEGTKKFDANKVVPKSDVTLWKINSSLNWLVDRLESSTDDHGRVSDAIDNIADTYDINRQR